MEDSGKLLEKTRYRNLKTFQGSERLIAQNMQPVLTKLLLERSVTLHIFGRPITNQTAIGVMRAHKHAAQLGHEITVQDTWPLLNRIGELNLGPCRIDLGALYVKLEKLRAERPGYPTDHFIHEELKNYAKGQRPVLPDGPQDVVIYGFGRIGRLLARELLEKIGAGDKLRLRAFVVRPEEKNQLDQRLETLRHDSIHGPFRGILSKDDELGAIIANGETILMIEAESPDKVDYTAYGIRDAIIIDTTGNWRDRKGLEKHLACPGVKAVLLSAPGKGNIPNIVYGINHKTLDPVERIVSAASCTTNAITPVLKVLSDHFGIVSGHIETVHAYTQDQHLLDNKHKKQRRGRAAPLNIVPTETGAGSAVAKALPELKGKLTANALRVPTPNVSLAILMLNLERDVTVDEINEALRDAALRTLPGQIDYTRSNEVASSDFVGSRHAGIVDSSITIVNGATSRTIVVYVWYDNERGYVVQLMRVLQQMAGINEATLPNYPAPTVLAA